MPRARSLPPRRPTTRRTPTLIFAYGTLMRGYARHRLLAPSATLLGPGRVRGRLIDLHGYPGLIDGRGRVHGEVYRVDDPELLAILDREEGYNFERRRTTVTLPRGRRARAWVYRYRGSQHRAVLIPDGDYRRARGAGCGGSRSRRRADSD